MGRLRYIAVLPILGALTLSACSTPPPPPTIHFVGNTSCPVAGQTPYDPSPRTTNGDGPAVGTAVDEMPHTHVNVGTTVTYNHNPPTSGCHYNTAGSATELAGPLHGGGVYDRVVPAEYWVHNLEHGYIVVLYNCPQPPGCDSDFQTIKAWFKALKFDTGFAYAKVLVLPWTTMSDKFAVVSWDWYLGMKTLDMNQIQAFYDNHKGQGPEQSAG